jgi:hypothetical protein
MQQYSKQWWVGIGVVVPLVFPSQWWVGIDVVAPLVLSPQCSKHTVPTVDRDLA